MPGIGLNTANKAQSLLGIVAHALNPSTWEAGAGDYSEFETIW